MNERIGGRDASLALVEIEQRRRQVVALMRVPNWFRWAVALLAIVMAAGLDSGSRLLAGLGTGLFVAGVLGVGGAVISRGPGRAPVRRELLTRPAVLAVAGFVGLAVLVNLVTALALDLGGISHPATVGAVAGGVVLIVGGPVLVRYLDGLADVQGESR